MRSSRLFTASCLALIVTAMSFALRGAASDAWAVQFHLTNEQVGWVNGTAFWGFTLAMLFGGPLCDALGLGKIVALAFVGHLIGILLTIFAWNYASLYAGTLIFGVANGSVEAACNPLITTLYPEEKTTKLNHFHSWFPGGIVIGGLLALPVVFALTALSVSLAGGGSPAPTGTAASSLMPVPLWLLPVFLTVAASFIGYLTTQITMRRWLRRLT